MNTTQRFDRFIEAGWREIRRVEESLGWQAIMARAHCPERPPAPGSMLDFICEWHKRFGRPVPKSPICPASLYLLMAIGHGCRFPVVRTEIQFYDAASGRPLHSPNQHAFD